MGVVNGLTLIQPAKFSFTGTSGTLSSGQMSFTSVSSLLVDNIFTSDFEDYILLIKWIANGTNGVFLGLQLRSGGVTESSTNYSYQYTYSYSGANVVPLRGTGQSLAYIGYMGNSNTYLNFAKVHISKPYMNSKTYIRSENASDIQSSYIRTIYHGYNVYSQAKYYDGIRVFNNSNQNITGTMNVYGVRK